MTIKCPYCEAEISATARKCRFCGEWVTPTSEDQSDDPNLDSPAPPPPPPPPPPDDDYPQELAAAPVTAPVAAPVAPAQPTATVQVPRQKDDSVLFAVLTLVLYIFLYPVGVLLNVVGIFTGPKRGCFLAMIFFLFMIPVGSIAFLLLSDIQFGWELLDDALFEVRWQIRHL